MFKVKNQLFDIKYAYLDGYINDNDQLVIGLQIKATKKNNHSKVEEMNTPDLFYSKEELLFNSEILLKINPYQIEKWQDIVGQKIEWKDYNEDEKEPHALLYVYEHEEIYNATIEFINRNNAIMVKIKAFFDIHSGKKPSDNLPLEIETEVVFLGILCGKNKTEEACIKNINTFLNIETLMFVQNKYGVSIMVPKDTHLQTNRLALGDY